MTKQVGTRAEEARVSIRNIRREGNDIAKKSQKNTEITEDDLKIVLKDIQELTDSSIKDVDSVLKEKENELMNI